MAEENNNDWQNQNVHPQNDSQTSPPETSPTSQTDAAKSQSEVHDLADGGFGEFAGGSDPQDSQTQTNQQPRQSEDSGISTVDLQPVQGVSQYQQPTTQQSAVGQGAHTDGHLPLPSYSSIGQNNSETAPNNSSAGPYRPAPEYGAYGPVPPQPNDVDGAGQAQGPQGVAAGAGSQGNGQYEQPGQYGQTGQGYGPNAQTPGGAGGNQNPFFPLNPMNNGTPGQQQDGQPPFGPGANGPQGPLPGFPNGMPGRGNRQTTNTIVVAVVAALVSAVLCLGVGFAAISNGWVTVPNASSLSDLSSNKSGSGTAKVKSGEAPDWTSVSKSVSGSVVSIQTQIQNGIAKGSGAILDSQGHIVTNNHVVSGAQAIQVTLANGQIYDAEVVGNDTTTDLAVIKLKDSPSKLTPVEFADSDQLAVGENIMAIGNPLGYDDTATAGIVSALNRPVSVMDNNQSSEVVTNAVQIDAAINPGNSGGPTFNGAGQVIGINSSIASMASSSSEAGSIGIGFAIPSNLVKRVANEIIKDGSVKHVKLGVTIKSAAVEADGVARGGAEITKGSNGAAAVVSGSPADKAGLKEGDVIVGFNGNAVNNNYSLLGYVRASAVGDKVKLTIVRDKKAMGVNVTLDQVEDTVKGNNRSERKDNSDGGSGNSDGNSDGNSGNSDGNSDGGNGLVDPFGLWK